MARRKTRKRPKNRKGSLKKTRTLKRMAKKRSRRLRRLQQPEKLYTVNKKFELLRELQALVLKASPVDAPPRFMRDLKKIGRIRLALMSGSFIGVDEARVDLLVVGENIKLAKLFAFIRDREMELGRELRYVILSPDEFSYRYEMFDRFLKDILESPHQKLINTLRIS